jgi:hypothetical protein
MGLKTQENASDIDSMGDIEKEELVQKFVYQDDFQCFIDNVQMQFKNQNIFEIVGMDHQEIKHSRTLGWLLGNNDQFSKRIFIGFIKKVLTTTELANEYPIDENQNRFKALKEYLYLNARDANFLVKHEHNDIDILLIDEKKKTVIFIENKVFAKESGEQLKKYRKSIQKEYPEDGDDPWKTFGIFLSPNAEEPNKKSNEGNKNRNFYFLASYEDVKESLISVLEESKQFQWTSEQIMIGEHYLDLLLRNNIVTNEKTQELAQKIWSSSEYKQALEILFDYKPDRQLEINKIIIALFQDEKWKNVIVEKSSKQYIRFVDERWDSLDFQRSGNEQWIGSKRLLAYQINNLPNKILLTLVIGPGDESHRSDLFEKCKASESEIGFLKSRSKASGTWTQIGIYPIIANLNDDMNLENIKDKITNKLDTFFSEEGVFNKVNEFMEGKFSKES